MAVAEQIGRESELRTDDKPKVNVNGIEELVTAAVGWTTSRLHCWNCLAASRRRTRS